MKVLLEEPTRYDQSFQWRIHDAYFASRGLAAWIEGEIPHRATGNYGAARQQARSLLALAGELLRTGRLTEDEPIYVLAVGAGLGTFASNFLRALDSLDQPALAARVRYLFSDYATANVVEALATRELAPWAASGRLIPARFDVRRPQEIFDLQGARLDPSLTAVVANYVCCVCPIRLIRKSEEGYEERYVKLELETDHALDAAEIRRLCLSQVERGQVQEKLQREMTWRPTSLGSLFEDPFHARVVEKLLGKAGSLAAYPQVFIDFLRALVPRMKPGGLALINDYAVVGESREPSLELYGNSLNHAVDFDVFDAACAVAGWTLWRTRDPLLILHNAALGLVPAREIAFSGREWDDDGDSFIVFRAAARVLAAQGEWLQAARLLRRCLSIEPHSVDVHYRLGVSCLNAEQYALAADYLQKGKQLDVEHRHDFAFELGRAHFFLGRLRESVECYQESLAHKEHPTSWRNLAAILMSLRDYSAAERALDRAWQMEPEHEGTRSLREQLARERSTP
jgi:tetratricopeptide (TPR) repeat protein